MPIPPSFPMPYKSVAVALVFTILLGPIGLLYASFWGGIFMMILCLYALSHQFVFITLLLWIICSLWSVRAVEYYNKKLFRLSL